MDTSVSKGIVLLERARGAYLALERFRQERERNKRYTYGDQWGDIIEVDGRHITEEQYIKEQGSIPLKNNLIRRLVRNVIGVYKTQTSDPHCQCRDADERGSCETMDRLLHYNMSINRMSALYTRSIEEFLISGMIIHKKTCGRRGGKVDCWTDYVQPNNFFIDTAMSDFRGWDCRLLGEIHQVSMADVWRQFAKNEDDCRWLASLFGVNDEYATCQVTEVWQRELRRTCRCHDRRHGQFYLVEADRESAPSTSDTVRQWSVTEVWHYYFIAPTGHILAEGDSPYRHGEHPYVYKVYPMIDGEVHSFVSDVIDQQRYTNRLITLYDWIMRASSKGVLLVPEDCIPRGCSPSDFADAWSRYNGVIFYKPSAQGAIPQQIANNSTNIGIRELLDVQLKFFEDISGVNNALQGKTSNVGISAELFNQQTLNATTTLLDVLETYNDFIRDAMYKDMKNILQYYAPEQVKAIAGKDADLSRLQDIEFDISLIPSIASLTQRKADNDLLMEIWRSGQITLQELLRAGDFTFKDKL